MVFLMVFPMCLKSFRAHLACGCLAGCLLSMLLTGCSGAYQNEENYSAIPSTNNPAVTRHNMNWQPAMAY